MSRDLYRHVFCFRVQNLTEIGQLAAVLWPKTIFKMAAVRQLEFLTRSPAIAGIANRPLVHE